MEAAYGTEGRLLVCPSITTRIQLELTTSDRPTFTLTLLHTPLQAPNLASFLVPLWFNKLDMKDYLWHVYGIGVGHVRSLRPSEKDAPRREK